MPENYVNIGVPGYPVWLSLEEKATIVAIQPCTYLEVGRNQGVLKSLSSTVTLVVDGCCVDVTTPMGVEAVCAVLGFAYVPEKTAPAEPEELAVEPESKKPEGE